MAHQQGHVITVSGEVCAGRALKLSQLDQGARVSTWQKAVPCVNSAPAMTDAASQTELCWEHAATRVLGCRVCPAPVPVPDGNSGHARGSCTPEKLLNTVTRRGEHSEGYQGEALWELLPDFPESGRQDMVYGGFLILSPPGRMC